MAKVKNMFAKAVDDDAAIAPEPAINNNSIAGARRVKGKPPLSFTFRADNAEEDEIFDDLKIKMFELSRFYGDTNKQIFIRALKGLHKDMIVKKTG